MAIAIDSRLSAAKSLLPAGCHQRIRYCQPAVTSEFAADSQYDLWMKLGGLLHGQYVCLMVLTLNNCVNIHYCKECSGSVVECLTQD